MLATAGVDGHIVLWDTVNGRQLQTLTGHKSWVNSVVFSSNGELLVSGSSDGTVKVWTAKRGELQKTIDASKAEVRSVAVSPDGKWLAAGIRYGEVKVWQADGWQVRHHLQLKTDEINAMAFLPVNTRLLIGTGDWNRPGRVEVFDISADKVVESLKYTGEVFSVAVSRDGKTIAAGGGDRAASVWFPKVP
jgi:WD40 repeat protein